MTIAQTSPPPSLNIKSHELKVMQLDAYYIIHTLLYDAYSVSSSQHYANDYVTTIRFRFDAKFKSNFPPSWTSPHQPVIVLSNCEICLRSKFRKSVCSCSLTAGLCFQCVSPSFPLPPSIGACQGGQPWWCFGAYMWLKVVISVFGRKTKIHKIVVFECPGFGQISLLLFSISTLKNTGIVFDLKIRNEHF
jgi:hypothetical protein